MNEPNFQASDRRQVIVFLPRLVLFSLLLCAALSGTAQNTPSPEQTAPATEVKSNSAKLTPPAAGENARSALSQIQQNVNRIQTLTAQLEMSEAKKVKPPKKNPKKGKGAAAKDGSRKSGKPKLTRVAKIGPLAIARGQGARLSLTRKNETKEYIANNSTLWVYDHKDKEAKYIPTSLPFITGFVNSAFSMDVFAAMDEETLKLRGTQEFEGEPCWVIEGKSPRKLALAGVEPTKLRFWVSKNDGIPRKISIPSEDDLEIVLREVQPGAPVDGSRFSWEPPAGVKSTNIFGF